jgi:hypothetical protein
MTTSTRRDPLVILGLTVVALSAAISSFAALLGTATLAGWSSHTAWLLPTTVDVTAMTSTRVWLAASTPTAAARRFARSTAFFSIAVSVGGNLTYHLTEAHVIRPGVALVIAAGAVPPLALAVVVHLAALRSADPVTATQTDVAPVIVEVAEPVIIDNKPVIVADSKPDTKRTPSRTDTAAKVAKLTAKHPDMKPAAMAAKLGVSDRTVRRHLAALATA